MASKTKTRTRTKGSASAKGGLLARCEAVFGTNDLYAVLGLESKDSSDAQMKKAYHKRSLEWHPDRHPEESRGDATEKFQVLGAVYAVLQDKDRRAVYDESGEVDDEGDALLRDGDRDWLQYWRNLFQKVTVADVHDFEEKFRDSDEEREAVKAAYIDGEGSMSFIVDNVLCATVADEPRFEAMIREWIDAAEVPALAAFDADTTTAEKKKRKRNAKKEEAEAEEMKKEFGLCPPSSDGDAALRSMIMKRQKDRQKENDSFLDGLAAKYANGGSGSGGGKSKKGKK